MRAICVLMRDWTVGTRLFLALKSVRLCARAVRRGLRVLGPGEKEERIRLGHRGGEVIARLMLGIA